MDRPHFGHRAITSEKCGTFKMYPACIHPIDLMGDTLQVLSANWGRIQFGYISNVSSMFRPGQIGVPWQGTFKMYPAYTHWAHWSHLLSVLPMYPVCAWWVFGSLSPVIAWEYLEATYGKPGIAATYKELKVAMDIVIPGNADPTLAIDTILVGFTRMAASKCAVPPHLQAMILISKLPYQMSALVQSICQTDNIEDLKTDDIKCKAILAWEQRSPVQGQNNRQQSACRLSAVQRPGPPPQFQQQQQPQQEEQDQGQGQRGGWQGGWRGGRGCGGRGMYRGTRAGKNKNQQEQARPIECQGHSGLI